MSFSSEPKESVSPWMRATAGRSSCRSHMVPAGNGCEAPGNVEVGQVTSAIAIIPGNDEEMRRELSCHAVERYHAVPADALDPAIGTIGFVGEADGFVHQRERQLLLIEIRLRHDEIVR